jgi:hypothetical protein
MAEQADAGVPGGLVRRWPAGQVIVWADEMPPAQAALVAPRGKASADVRRYLVLAGRLWWRSKESVFEVLKWFKAEGIEAAPGHTAVNLPPYSPELNPVELRRQIGR